jgi:ribonuclease P protein component
MKNTIKARKEIDRAFREGRSIRTPGFIAIIVEPQQERDRDGRVAFIAGKKLGSAPMRSRAKRRMREAAREGGAPWNGKDVVFVARERTTTRSYRHLVDDMSGVARCCEEGTDKGDAEPGRRTPRRRAAG